jgi:hypothetical protein
VIITTGRIRRTFISKINLLQPSRRIPIQTESIFVFSSAYHENSPSSNFSRKNKSELHPTGQALGERCIDLLPCSQGVRAEILFPGQDGI